MSLIHALTIIILVGTLTNRILAAPQRISASSERAQLVTKADQIANLVPSDPSAITNPFTIRKSLESTPRDDAAALLSDITAVGAQIQQVLNPSGILRKNEDAFLQFQGGKIVKPGDPHTVIIGKNSYIIQITRIGSDDFDFTYQGKTFTRLIKSK
jgi:hypothetical protein